MSTQKKGYRYPYKENTPVFCLYLVRLAIILYTNLWKIASVLEQNNKNVRHTFYPRQKNIYFLAKAVYKSFTMCYNRYSKHALFGARSCLYTIYHQRRFSKWIIKSSLVFFLPSSLAGSVVSSSTTPLLSPQATPRDPLHTSSFP